MSEHLAHEDRTGYPRLLEGKRPTPATTFINSEVMFEELRTNWQEYLADWRRHGLMRRARSRRRDDRHDGAPPASSSRGNEPDLTARNAAGIYQAPRQSDDQCCVTDTGCLN